MAEPVTKQANDGLQNALSGMGMGADKQAYNRWTLSAYDYAAEAEAAYRTSWLGRKIHDLPPFDMTREWRSWQADEKQIEALEAEEKRLGLRLKVMQALVWARLRGGAALVLGGLPGDVRLPANAGAIGKGGLKYVHVVTRDQIMVTDVIRDINDAFFGQPKAYSLTGENGSVDIHPSRVIPFVGQPLPPTMRAGGAADLFWGDPLWSTIRDAVTNAAVTHEGIAQMIQEAKVDTISIPGLMELVATEAGEARLVRRMNVANLAKSITNSRIMDAEEKWETRQLSFTGLPDVLMAFLNVVAGAADIPVTRLLGTSAKGLNATGEGDEKNYLSMIGSRQEVELRPLLERLDEYLIPSALGSRPPEVHFTFAPLQESEPKILADIEKTRAETVQIYANAGLIPDSALAKTVQNALVESGQWPGLEAALAEAEAEGDIAGILEEPEDPDPSALTTGPDGKPQENGAPEKVVANDATPRPLYVSRKVLNVAEITAWAKAQGIPDLQDDLHVTIAYSRTPIDWIKTAEDWGGANDKGEITLPPGGPRVVEPLGEMSAVLMFGAWQLEYRHERILAAGASWDWATYQPHISLTKTPLDVSKVEPYRGKIVLGPEIYEELDLGHGDD